MSQVEILLLTSRGKGRWVIPKGWPMRKRAPDAAAAREAYEEAGIEGVVSTTAVGSYHYAKGPNSAPLRVTVDVFLLQVERQHATWPEQAERETQWFTPEAAALMVAEPELAALIRGTPTLLARHAA